MLLRDVPERVNTANSKRLLVAVEGTFSLAVGTGLRVRSYGTRIVWLHEERLGGSAPRLQFRDGYHFDAEIRQCGPSPAVGLGGHPFFHAQRGCAINSLNLTGAPTDGPVVVDRSSTSVGCQNIRIPTAQLDLVSALLMVVGSHLVGDARGDSVFSGLLQQAEQIAWKHHMALTPRFSNMGATDPDFRGLTWYPPPTSRQP